MCFWVCVRLIVFMEHMGRVCVLLCAFTLTCQLCDKLWVQVLRWVCLPECASPAAAHHKLYEADVETKVEEKFVVC